jgi:hypothetical protein
MANPLKEFMQQKWERKNSWYLDQFGNYIIKTNEMFELYHKGEYQLKTFSLEAAKEISLVLINDRIMNG